MRGISFPFFPSALNRATTPMGPVVMVMGVQVARLQDMILSKLIAFVNRSENKEHENATWGLGLSA